MNPYTLIAPIAGVLAAIGIAMLIWWIRGLEPRRRSGPEPPLPGAGLRGRDDAPPTHRSGSGSPSRSAWERG